MTSVENRRHDWRPTKFLFNGKHWIGAATEGLSSKLMCDLQVAAYEKALHVYASGRLADLGCGNAPLYGIYGPCVDDVVWIDWPSSAHQLFKLDLEHDLTKPLPIESSSFDTVVLSDVLEHISEPKALIGEIARLLRPNGIVILGVPFLYWIHEEPNDHFRYTRYQLAHLAKASGLEVLEINEVGGAFDTWADLTAKLLGSVWRPLAALPHYGWAIARAIPAIRNLNNRAAWRFPLGYLAVLKKPSIA